MKLLLCLVMVSAVFAQTGKIAGTVVDENGDGVIGAAVLILETKQGVCVTSPGGRFTILGVPAGLYTLQISSIGYKRQTFVAVEVDKDGTADEIFAVLEEEKLVVTCHFRRRVEYVHLDECNRVRRFTQKELQRLPGW